MKLEIFNKSNMVRNDIIRTYTYAQYIDELSGRGSFEIRIPTTEETLMYLTYGNYILFEDGVVGIIKGVKDTEDSDVEITVYGYLTNHILEYRSFLLTSRYYDTIGNIARQMFYDLFINPEDVKRKISFLKLSEDPEYIPTIPGNVRIQNTGDTLYDVYSEILLPYDLGFELYPIISNYIEGEPSPNLSAMELRLITPVDRTIGNTDGNTPVVFSFDLDNLALLEYEEDGRVYNTIAIVASEGEGQDRKVIEVGELEKTGIDRIELYVDARDLQSGEEPTSKITITITSSDTTLGTVTGGGQYDVGDEVTATATPIGDATFVGWYENDTLVSSQNPYTFEVSETRTIQGLFVSSIVPSGYTELKAVKKKATGSSATTGNNLTLVTSACPQNIKIDMEVNIISLYSNSTSTLVLMQGTGSGAYNWINIYSPITTNKFGLTTRYSSSSTAASVDTTVSDATGQHNIIVDTNNSKMYVDNVETNISSIVSTFKSVSNGGTFMLGRAGNSFVVAEYGRIKIYDGSTLVYDFVPVKKDSNSDFGFYDLVNNNFVQASSTHWEAVERET